MTNPMTPTEQDKELRAEVKQVLKDGFNYYIGERKDVSSDMKPLDIYCTEHLMQLITADRKRVALEARIDELNRLMEYTDENEIVCVCEQASVQVCDHNWSLCHKARERIAELRQKVGRDDQPE